MADYPTLDFCMRALRLFAMALSMAIISWWGASLVRVMGGNERGRDASRALWVMAAFGMLLFQVKWLAPLPDLIAMRVWVVAQCVMIITLLAVIYDHGSESERFNRSRVFAVHLVMIALCMLFASVTR